MGAALLQNQSRAVEIIKALRTHLPPTCRVSCKIRLLDSVQETVFLMENLIAAGSDAIAVHARYVPDRPTTKARLEVLKEVLQHEFPSHVDLIVNGDLGLGGMDYSGAVEMAKEMNCAGMMFSRFALKNPAFAAYPTQIELVDLLRNYLITAYACDNQFANTKWNLTQICSKNKHGGSVLGRALFQARSYADLRAILHVEEARKTWDNLVVEQVDDKEREAILKQGSADAGVKRPRLEVL